MLISVDHPWCCAVSSIEGFTKKSFCSSSIPLSCEEKVQGIPILVNSSIQPLPLTFDLDIDFIHSLRMTGWM